MQGEDVVLQCAAITKSRRYGTMVPNQNAALRVTMWERLAADLSEDFMRQVTRNLFGAPVPEADSLLFVEHVNANRQVLEHGPVDGRIFKKRGHDSPVRLSAERAGNFRGALAAVLATNSRRRTRPGIQLVPEFRGLEDGHLTAKSRADHRKRPVLPQCRQIRNRLRQRGR